jgi:hypothetical protein
LKASLMANAASQPALPLQCLIELPQQPNSTLLLLQIGPRYNMQVLLSDSISTSQQHMQNWTVSTKAYQQGMTHVRQIISSEPFISFYTLHTFTNILANHLAPWYFLTSYQSPSLQSTRLIASL